MVTTFDEQLAEKIVGGMDSQPDADDYLSRPAEAAPSGVKLLVIVYPECDKLGCTASRLILEEINAMTARGLSDNPTAAVSNIRGRYRTDLVRLNNSLMRGLVCAATTTSSHGKLHVHPRACQP